MKKFLKFLKYCFFAIAILIVLGLATIYIGHKFIFPIPYSETTTIPDIKEGGLCLGVGCQPPIKTVDAFIPAFADQLIHYNQVAPSLWPDNQVVNLYAAVQSIESGKSWLISPEGNVSSLTSEELKEICPIQPKYNIGFELCDSDSMQVVYLALSEEALNNVLEYQKYQYLGSYDLLLTYNHEMFHKMEQDQKWESPETIDNGARDPRFDQLEARTERLFIVQLLQEAMAAETQSQRDSLILQALSNYQYYRNTFPEDYKAAQYFDRIEGTAHYYEIVSSLYSAYPEQIYSAETLHEALRLLAKSNNPKPYEEPGIVNESYVLGAWAGFLLDEVQADNSEWKTDIMQNPDLTPMDILAQQFEGMPLPDPVRPSSEIENEVKDAILAEENKQVAPGIFRLLYQLIF